MQKGSSIFDFFYLLEEDPLQLGGFGPFRLAFRDRCRVQNNVLPAQKVGTVARD